jgi:hypothetical protein
MKFRKKKIIVLFRYEFEISSPYYLVKQPFALDAHLFFCLGGNWWTGLLNQENFFSDMYHSSGGTRCQDISWKQTWSSSQENRLTY